MAEKLNPLKTWLGVDVGKPSYYQLFGLENFESEPPVIADAADRAIRKAQKHVGGAHGETAEKLVRDLTQVKHVLLSADKRRAYDEQLRKQLGGGSPSKLGASKSVQQAVASLPQAVEAADSPTMMLPPGALSAALSLPPTAGLPPQSLPPSSLPPGALPPGTGGYPPGAMGYGAAPAGYGDPMQAMYPPTAGMPPQMAPFGQPGMAGMPQGYPPTAAPGPEPVGMYNYGPPPGASGMPEPVMAQPGYAHPGMPQPAMAATAAGPMGPQSPAGPGFVPKVSTGRVRAAVARKQRQSNVTLALAVLGVAAVVLVVVIVIANQKTAEQEAEQNQAALNQPPQKAVPSLPSANLPTSPLVTPPTGAPTPQPREPSEMERLQRMAISPTPEMPAPSPTSTPGTTPAASPGTPAAAAPALTIRGVTVETPLMEAALPEDAARARSVPTMLTAARTSLRNRDYAKAEEIILQAQITADTPALVEMAMAHGRALDLVRTFWDAARLGLKDLKAGDELMFNAKSATVVRADEVNLVVKLDNQDVPLVVDKLIPLVAAQLAERALPKDDAASKLVVGMFLILDQPTGVQRGRQLFDEAAVAGLDVHSLRPLVDAK